MRCSLVPREDAGAKPLVGPVQGKCSREDSLIKVSIHPYLNVPMISLSIGCHCPDGEEKCLEICNQEAIKFVPRDEAAMMLLQEEWFPCPVI